jgi:hypothetical protein
VAEAGTPGLGGQGRVTSLLGGRCNFKGGGLRPLNSQAPGQEGGEQEETGGTLWDSAQMRGSAEANCLQSP